jgi:hypothetical protein
LFQKLKFWNSLYILRFLQSKNLKLKNGTEATISGVLSGVPLKTPQGQTAARFDPRKG